MAYSFLKDNNDPIVNQCSTYIDVVKNHVVSTPDHVVFRFLSDGVNESESLTFKQLETRSKALGTVLQNYGAKGDNVLLLFQPGLSYVASMFACFYSGFVAIPAYPPRRNKGIDRIYTIIEDSGANICLVSQNVYNDIQRNFPNDKLLSQINWIIYEEISDKMAFKFMETNIIPSDIALLQYTSGSTGNPKGVLVTQLNLLYNSENIRQAMGLDRETVGVHWLPIFHDMGLIGGLLQVAFLGAVNIGMPPTEFLKRPVNWLKAIDKYGGTNGGGPDFTYNYCSQKITNEECSDLNLSTLKVLYSGSEQIRKSTFKEFSHKFAISKFREEQFYPCYGMAETTLIVTGGYYKSLPKYLKVDSKALSINQVIILDEHSEEGTELVGCGHTWMETVVEIVDPFSMKRMSKNEVGEIWVSGPTVAEGYWNKPEETKRVFGAKISDTNEGPFLRTGDLGFFHDNELYITGRIKDLIIIRGVNYHPNDIEFSIQNVISELRHNGGAAFSITDDNVEKLVVVQELERTALRNVDHDRIIESVREVISTEHLLDVHSVVLINTGSISVTSSGKIQHRQTKYEYLHGDLNIVASWEKQKSNADVIAIVTETTPSEEAIKEWVINWIMRNQNFQRKEVDLNKNLMSYGIDSLAAVTLETEISIQFGFQWHISSFMLNPTINKLASEGMEIYNESIGQ